VREAGFVPCRIDEQARPVPGAGEAGGSVARYVEDISRTAGLTTTFTPRRDAGIDRVVVGAADGEPTGEGHGS
jgi:hypothetical protein